VLFRSAALGYALAGGVWRWWEAADIRRFLRREAYPLWAPELVLLLTTAGALVGAGALALRLSPADLGGGPAIVLVPVMVLMLTGVLLRVGGVAAWLLTRVGLLRPGHYPPRDRELVFVLGPSTALLTGVLVLADGGAIKPNLTAFLLLLFGPPVLVGFVVPLLTSSRRVRHALSPLGVWAYAQPVAVAAAPLLEEPKAIAALEDAAARQLAKLSLLDDLEVPEGAAQAAARRRADLADDAVTLAMALDARGRTPQARRLLVAFAPESLDAALALLELSVPTATGDAQGEEAPPVADAVRILGAHAQAAPWAGRRRAQRALQAIAPGTASVVPA
jgi:hypothetical protein